MLMRNILRRDANLWGIRNTRKENDRPSEKKIRDDEERLKGQERKGNRKYLRLIFNLSGHYTVLRSNF